MDDLVEIVGDGDLVVARSWMRRVAGAAVVWRNHSVASVRDWGDDMSPLVGGVWVAVDQQNGASLLLALGRAVDVMNPDFPGLIDKGKAVLPSLVVNVRRIERRHVVRLSR